MEKYRRSQSNNLKQCHQTAPRSGFTLLELVVVCGIVSILVALILPAVQSSREAGRRVECQNHLKQISTAIHTHESSFSRFPANGWGFQWVGHPERGTDRNQPGGWIYNILPYIDQLSLRLRGKGTSGNVLRASIGEVMQSPIPIFRCPSRSSTTLSLANPVIQPPIADPPVHVAKTDYAINEGDFITNTSGGPATLQAGDQPAFPWTDVSQATGVSYLRSEVRLSDVRDGASHTYLAGEKYVSVSGYETNLDPGYDQSLICGVDLDNARWTIVSPRCDGNTLSVRSFGSAHHGACWIARCDGSVKSVSYNIDLAIHISLGNRGDGRATAGE